MTERGAVSQREVPCEVTFLSSLGRKEGRQVGRGGEMGTVSLAGDISRVICISKVNESTHKCKVSKCPSSCFVAVLL